MSLLVDWNSVNLGTPILKAKNEGKTSRAVPTAACHKDELVAAAARIFFEVRDPFFFNFASNA